jgi:hypothetical protein
MTIQANFPAIKTSLLLDFANTKQLDSRITYTRASTASFYNGVTTAKAEENLLTYSQEFDNAAWSSFSNALTRTANQTTAPDGTTTADSIVGDGTTNIHYFGQLVTLSSTSTYAFSFYAKANGLNYVQVFLGSGTSFANFDITSGAGATGTSGGQFGSLAIQDAGSGWFRCSLIMTNPSSSNVYFCLVNSASSARAPSIAVSTGIYLWGAQAEQRSAVTAYTATTTQAITNYIPALQSAASGVARFDNNPTTGESLGLLIEESRTNLVTYSSQFDDSVWSIVNVTVSANAAVAPDGTLTADRLISAATTNLTYARQLATLSAGSATWSVYVKQYGVQYLQLFWGATFNATDYVNFDITNGTVTAGTYTSASITNVGNGWYRCSITSTVAAGSGVYVFAAIVATSTSTRATNYTGNGYSGAFYWGAQLEAGAFATSYIPTVASQVTRAADSASMTGTNFSTWFNAGEGTIYSESNTAAFSTSSNDRCVVEVNDTSSSNFLRIQRRATSQTSSARCTALNNDVMQLNSLGSWTTADYKKVIVVYKFNDAAASADAGTVSTDTSFSLPVVTKLEIGSARSGDFLCGTIKKIAYYPLRVTNAQLQALTS